MDVQLECATPSAWFQHLQLIPTVHGCFNPRSWHPQSTTRWFQASSSAPLVCSIVSMMPSLLPLPIVVMLFAAMMMSFSQSETASILIVRGNLCTRHLQEEVLPSTPSICSLPLLKYVYFRLFLCCASSVLFPWHCHLYMAMIVFVCLDHNIISGINEISTISGNTHFLSRSTLSSQSPLSKTDVFHPFLLSGLAPSLTSLHQTAWDWMNFVNVEQKIGRIQTVL